MRFLRPALLAIALGTALAPLAGAETLTRCIGPAGELTWSNVGCAPAERAEPMDVKPTVVDSRGLRDWAKRVPARRESVAERRAREAAPARAPKVRDVVACENAQRAYRFEAESRLGKRGGMGPLREEVRRACGGS